MIYHEEELLNEAIKSVLSIVSGVIKTAPKSRGLNALKTIVITAEDKNRVAEAMTKYERPAFKRDAQNIKEADAVIMIGMKTIYAGLDCGLCQHHNCKESESKNGLCVFNMIDLGIALGSSVSTLAEFKVDNRIMYTVGYALRDLNIMEKEYHIIMGIPLKYSKKNIFFDRK